MIRRIGVNHGFAVLFHFIPATLYPAGLDIVHLMYVFTNGGWVVIGFLRQKKSQLLSCLESFARR